MDGSSADWRGRLPGFGGALFYSRGELLYQDHLFDAWGADDGRDAQRLAVQDPLLEALPETYRIDPALQANLPGEFGLPAPEQLEFSTNYGDVEDAYAADLSELRLAATAEDLFVLARTTTMLEGAETRSALLVLLDTGGDESEPLEVPFGAGIQTTRADKALLLIENRGWVADLHSGAVVELPAGSVATNAAGWENAIEARVSREALGDVQAVAAAAGLADPGADRLKDLGLGANLANVAFRTDEPVRDWWDKRQALALHAGTIDPFFAPVDMGALAGGANERWRPGPGYHERIFRSSEDISEERLEPADPEAGVASFDGTSAAIAEQPYTAVPEAGGPAAIGQTGPFVMTGMQWLTGLAGDAPEPANEFTATLTGARGVRLNLERMGIDVTRPATATIETDTPLTLELRADWGPGEGRVKTFELPAGKNELELEPAG